MVKKELNQNKIMAITFLVCLFLIAIISNYKTVKFYACGEIDYNEWNASTDTRYETDLISNFLLKYQYVNLNGAVRNILGQHEMNNIVKLNNGYLVKPFEYVDEDLVESNTNGIVAAKNRLQEKGIDYVWFTLPYSVDKYEDMMPAGIDSDYGNQNMDRITESLSENSVNVVDLRECLNEDGLSTYDIFFRTDHHWNMQGGFWAFNQIVSYIEKTYGVEVDSKIKNIDNYEVDKYEKWHLGSNGQRTGKYYAGIDDFDLISPKFETEVEDVETGISGSVPDMMYSKKSLSKKNYMSRYTYDNVLGGSVKQWHNPNASVDMKVVIVGDSMSKVVFPFLSLAFTDVAFRENRSEKLEENWEFIDEFNPDIVISFYYPGTNLGL